MSERWQAGDVVIWFETGSGQDSKTDSDIFLRFYDENSSLLAWVHAFERVDLGGFEEGEINCGYLGNLSGQPWLSALFDRASRLGVRIEHVSVDRPRWYVERICLDFLAEERTIRAFEVHEWIDQDDGEKFYDAEPGSSKGYDDVGFEHELEIDAGGPDDEPESA